MIARVLKINVGPERVQQLVDSYEELLRPIFATAPGLHCHYVLANRATGDVQVIGMWESEEAVKAIAPRLEPIRERMWSQFGGAPPSDVFEVAEEVAFDANRHIVRCDFGGPTFRKA